MKGKLEEGRDGRLERLCGQAAGLDGRARRARIRIGAGAEGIERLEASFLGQAFAPHRHDTYAIGLTLSGVQTFRYRGAQRFCLPGQLHILHPDEVHDGGAATEEGFSYRILYVDPRLIAEALGGGPLPFAREPIVDAAPVQQVIWAKVFDIDAPIDDVTRVDIIVALAHLLATAPLRRAEKSAALAHDAVARVRDRLAANPKRQHSMDALERLSGLDRWTLARQFRAAFGTSPSRFRTLRQLDAARHLMAKGVPVAQAAAEAGFSDQSHMSRRFKSAYGLTPAAWGAAIGGAPLLSRSGRRWPAKPDG
jgi:AraC-like DNA-binding protein